MKRALCLLLSLLLLCSAALPAAQAADAEDEVPKSVLKLMKKFPHLAYWNHVGSPTNNPDGVTSSPCPTHEGCSWEPGACSCNSFSNAIQCMGFAYKAGYDLVGTDPRSWEMSETLDASKLRVGDVIRYRGNRHSLCVTGVRGNVIAFVDANWFPMCQIRWSSMDLDDMPSFTYVLHDPDNNQKNRNVTFFSEGAAVGSSRPSAQSPAAPLKGEIWRTTGNMNLRTHTSTDSAVLGQVPEDTLVAVKKKKINNGYLWGSVDYGDLSGWIALDHCEYQKGATDAPRFSNFPSEVSAGVGFDLTWSEVEGADSYVLSVFDSAGSRILQKTYSDNKARITVSKAGSYNALVESRSDHAASWRLQSAKVPFAVKRTQELKIESISLNRGTLTLTVGQTARLIASILPEDAPVDTVTMTSGNPAVVTVDSKGLVKGVGFGQTMVACADSRSGHAAICSVSVVPGAPKKLIQYMSRIRVNSITLKWTAVPGAKSYRVYRKEGSNFKQIATVADNLYVNEGLKEGTTYTYRVCACSGANGSGLMGDFSPTLTASTRPEAPAKVKFATKDGKVKVIWSANKHASKYIVYRSKTGKANTFKKIAVVKGKNNYLLRNQKKGAVQYYKVVAVKTMNGKIFASRLSKTGKVKVK